MRKMEANPHRLSAELSVVYELAKCEEGEEAWVSNYQRHPRLHPAVRD
jgi:hypothetical protein